MPTKSQIIMRNTEAESHLLLNALQRIFPASFYNQNQMFQMFKYKAQNMQILVATNAV
jgi:hypothetical protein